MDFGLTNIFPSILSSFWAMKEIYFFIFGFLILSFALRIGIDLIDRRSKIRWLLGKKQVQELQKLTPTQFEEYIAVLFKSLGYNTRVTGGKSDGGVDVEAEKDGHVHYIQCKKYISSKVPVGAIRDFYGAIADRIDGGKGYFITTNVFTLEAEKFAENKPIELIDKFKLMEYMKLVNVSAPEAESRTCPKCGGELVQISGKRGQFLGCSNYPKCHHTESL